MIFVDELAYGDMRSDNNSSTLGAANNSSADDDNYTP